MQFEEDIPNRRTQSWEQTGEDATTSVTHGLPGSAKGLRCYPPCKLTGELVTILDAFLSQRQKTLLQQKQ